MHPAARRRAHRGIGVRKRDFRSLPSCQPSNDEWIDFLSLPGCDGGFSASLLHNDDILPALAVAHRPDEPI
eukprot:9297145-Pyramimonas_sp.AAC.1